MIKMYWPTEVKVSAGFCMVTLFFYDSKKFFLDSLAAYVQFLTCTKSFDVNISMCFYRNSIVELFPDRKNCGKCFFSFLNNCVLLLSDWL